MELQTKKYFGWENWEAMRDDFLRGEYDYETGEYAKVELPANFPSDEEVVFAAYDTPAYSGSALVVYRRDGKLYEVNASHCSCYGLEDQFGPEETTLDALKKREFYIYSHEAFSETGQGNDPAEARQAWQTFTGTDLNALYEQEQAKWN